MKTEKQNMQIEEDLRKRISFLEEVKPQIILHQNSSRKGLIFCSSGSEVNDLLEFQTAELENKSDEIGQAVQDVAKRYHLEIDIDDSELNLTHILKPNK